MQKHLRFFKISGIVVKITAWVLLFLGLAGGVSIIAGFAPETPRWIGVVVLVIYGFLAFTLYLIGQIAGAVVKIINQITKE